MGIQLTDSAAQRVKQFLEKEKRRGVASWRQENGLLRLGVRSGIASEFGNNDQVFEDKGIKIVVDNESLPYLDGSSIDFTQSGLNRTFQFSNPNATDECGCGESFTIS